MQRRIDTSIMKADKNVNETEIKVFPIDIDEYYDFLVAAHNETFKLTFGSLISEEFLNKEFVRTKQDSADDANSVVGAFIGNEIVGHAVLEVNTRDDGSQFGWIHFYYVSPKSRRQGVGKSLVSYSIDYFSSLGLKEFFLRTGEFNTGAQSFYLNTGFTHLPEGDRKSLNDVNELLMRYVI